jgi:hypothetical protein
VYRDIAIIKQAGIAQENETRRETYHNVTNKQEIEKGEKKVFDPSRRNHYTIAVGWHP